MDIENRLAEGIKAHQAGDLEAAYACYRTVLTENPDHPDGLHFLGLLLFRPDDPDTAISLIRQSLELDPQNASAHNNLGNILKLIDCKEEALSHYAKSLAINADQEDAWHNLGILSASAGRLPALLTGFSGLIEGLPEKGDAWRVYGLALDRLGRKADAIKALDKSLTLGVGSPLNAVRAARVMFALGAESLATSHLKRLAGLFPGDVEVAFHLAAARGEPLDHVPEDYLRSHFDGFSESFDEVLQGLDYTTPEHVARVAQKLAAERGSGFSDVVDLGCGTGLCGPLIRDISDRLTGLDLSTGMLRKAAERGSYDFLVEGELVAFLNADLPTAFDLAVCVDTLCYLGDLGPFFSGLAKALTQGGMLVASVEKLPSDGEAFRLNASGRYAHSADYLRQAARAAGLRYGPEEDVVLRKEFGSDVQGLIFQATRA